MLSSMKSQFLIHCLLLLLLPSLLHCAGPAAAAPADDLINDFTALDALRRTLNSTLLNSTWIGLPCLGNNSVWTGLSCINSRVVAISLEGLGLSGRIDNPSVLANLTELTLLSFKNNSIAGDMFNFPSNPTIVSIDLSMNQFSGPISDSLLGLTQLDSLQLQHNKLSGTIPPLCQPSLKAFNVSYNNLTGSIPATPALQSFDRSAYTGNPGLCGPPKSNSCLMPMPPVPNTQPPIEEKGGSNWLSNTSPLVISFMIVDIIALYVVFWAIYASYKRRRRRRSTISSEKRDDGEANGINDEAEGEEAVEIDDRRRRKIEFVRGDCGFDLDYLLKASAENLGKGSFGPTFKVVLEDDRPFVVKRLRDVSPMTDEEFAGRIGVVAGMEHPNLVHLVGYYCSMEEKLLVYNFVPNGNLYERIYGGRGEATRIPFKWNSRLLVAKHIARAMDYLHKTTNKSSNSSVVPHCNLKSSNVLLDSDDSALVADYGLLPLMTSTLAPRRFSAYQSPDYEHGRSLCCKSDVWSYGVLLLELVARHFPNRSLCGAELVGWVHRAVREEWTCEVFDAEIATSGDAMQGMFKLMQLALWCCEVSAAKRPEMAEVAREVEAIMPCDEEAEGEEETTSSRIYVAEPDNVRNAL